MVQEVRRIILKAIPEGIPELKNFAKQMADTNAAVKDIDKSLKGMGNMLKSVFVGGTLMAAGRSFLQLSDSMQMMSDRIGNLTKDGTPAATIIERLGESAQRSRVPVTDLANTYARLALATSNTSLSTNSLIELNEALAKTFMISGSSAREAQAASVQLTQGLSANVLRGEEFNSVLEQNGKLAQLLAKQITGGNVGALRALAREGKLVNSVVLGALGKSIPQITEDMDNLRLTVGQASDMAFNKFSLAVFRLNQNLEISQRLGKAILFLTDNFKYLAIAMGAIAIGSIPLLVSGFVALRGVIASLNLLTRKNVILLALTGIAMAGTAIYDNWTKVKDLFATTMEIIVDVAGAIAAFMANLATFNSTGSWGKATSESFQWYKDSQAKIAKMREQHAKDAESERKAQESNLMADLAKLQGGAMGGEVKTREILAALNKQFVSGAISAKEYFAQIDGTRLKMLQNDFKQGRKDLAQYNEEMAKFKQNSLNRELRDGSLSMTQFAEASSKVAQSSLWQQVEAGALSLKDYNDQVSKLQDNSMTTWEGMSVGAMRYYDSIQSYSEGVANITMTTLKGVEDQFVDLVAKGEANWSKLGETIMNELLRITYQLLIMRPLMNAVGGMFATSDAAAIPQASSVGNYAMPNAKGNAFGPSGVIPFAKGGVVDKATPFTFGGGKLGVMGEAGAEGILPLRRTSSGDLGVQGTTPPVYITINNQSGGEVQTSETTGDNGERMIEMTIMAAVGKGFESGKFDTTMKRAYGIQRKGS